MRRGMRRALPSACVAHFRRHAQPTYLDMMSGVDAALELCGYPPTVTTVTYPSAFGDVSVKRDFESDMTRAVTFDGYSVMNKWDPWERVFLQAMLVPMFEHQVAKLVQATVSGLWDLCAHDVYGFRIVNHQDFELHITSTYPKKIFYQVKRRWRKHSHLTMSCPAREFRNDHPNGALVRDIQFLLCGKEYDTGLEWVPQPQDAFVDAVRRPLRSILYPDVIGCVLSYLIPQYRKQGHKRKRVLPPETKK